MKKKVLTSNTANIHSYYNEQQILKVWDVYIQSKHLKYWFDNEEGNSIFSNAEPMNIAKRAGILLNENGTLYRNQNGNSVSISGPVDYMSFAHLLGGYHGITNDINIALNQIKEWNLTPTNNLNRISSHTIIFPYHITAMHWGLGVLNLSFDNNGILNSRLVIELYNPLPDCGGTKISDKVKNELLSSIRQIFETLITLNNFEKNYNKQQNDGSSCGVISAENGKDIIDGGPQDRIK